MLKAPKIIEFIKKHGVKISPIEPTTSEAVWLKKGKNLFNFRTIPNVTINGVEWTFTNSEAKLNGNVSSKSDILKSTSTGITLPAGTYKLIVLKKSGSYVKPSGTDAAFYVINSSGTRIAEIVLSSLDNAQKITSTITLNEETELYFSSYANANTISFSNLVLGFSIVQGTEYNEYDDYIDKEIYVKNNNGIYGKFANVDNIVNEVETGDLSYNSTYVDGTPDLAVYSKYGKLVNVVFRAKLANSIPNQKALITLPYTSSQNVSIFANYGGRYASEGTHFMYFSKSGTNFYISTWSRTDKYIHINVMYICE